MALGGCSVRTSMGRIRTRGTADENALAGRGACRALGTRARTDGRSGRSSFYEGPIFGSTTAGSSLLVADAGRGVVNGDNGALVAALPGVDDVAVRSGGGLWATTGAGEDPEEDTGQGVWRISGSSATLVANLFEYEEKVNPHPATVDSNPFDVADAGGGKALVADAGGNSLLLVSDDNSPNSDVASRVKLIATLPDELVSTANAKSIFGCPAGPPDICNLPPMIPAQPVATSVAVGPDGAYYVGELKGFPAPTGESRVWRIEPGSQNVRCGEARSARSSSTASRRSSTLRSGRTGSSTWPRSTTPAGWRWRSAPESAARFARTSSRRTRAADCDELVDGVPILTSITYRGQALWGSILALVRVLRTSSR